MTNDELEDYVCNWGGDMISNIKAAQKLKPSDLFFLHQKELSELSAVQLLKLEFTILKLEFTILKLKFTSYVNENHSTEHNSRASRLDAKAIISRCMDNGITDGKQIEAEIEKYGISKRTMRRAKKELGITSVKQRNQGMFTSGEWVRETIN